MVSKRVVEEPVAESTINYIKVQSQIDGRFLYTGRISGKQYEWPSGGAIVEVDELDVPELLSKRLGGTLCCGSSGGNKIFDVVGD
jgi:hypothetical protein